MDADLGFPHTVLSYLSRPPGYKKFLQVLGKSKDGENLLTRNWDLCIVLDACRADLLQSVLEEEAWSPPEEWSWNTITSVDSHTIPWSRKTFLGPVSGETTPTTYVTATPQSTEVSDSDRIAELDEVWRYAWDDTLGTVPPGAVTDRAIHHYRTGSNRVLAHYLQPHVPLLTRDDEALRPYFGASEGQPNDGAVTPQSESDDGASDTATVFEWLPGEWDLATGDSTYLFDRLLSRVQSMSEPFFLWVFLLEPHWPYRPSKEHRNGRSTWEMYNLNWKASPLSDTTPNADDETGINDLYNGAVREADRFLGRIREDLASYDPVYVIHGDHGEALGERGNWGHGSLYDEVIRVPLVVANAGDEASVDRPTSLRMLSRLIETIGQDDSVDWESLGKPYVLSKTRRDAYAIRGRDWKFYERDGTASFFDLEADPGELSPISPDSVHVGSTLKDLVSLYDHRFEESQQIARAVTDRFT
jgi:hypothetical protein